MDAIKNIVLPLKKWEIKVGMVNVRKKAHAPAKRWRLSIVVIAVAAISSVLVHTKSPSYTHTNNLPFTFLWPYFSVI